LETIFRDINFSCVNDFYRLLADDPKTSSRQNCSNSELGRCITCKNDANSLENNIRYDQ
jgi:hypothetical protein